MSIPTIENTQEALAFGKIASPEQIELLKELRKVYVAKAVDRPENASMEELHQAMIHITKAQFMREALESAGYTVQE